MLDCRALKTLTGLALAALVVPALACGPAAPSGSICCANAHTNTNWADANQ